MTPAEAERMDDLDALERKLRDPKEYYRYGEMAADAIAALRAKLAEAERERVRYRYTARMLNERATEAESALAAAAAERDAYKRDAERAREALKSVRMFVQDCLDNSHDRACIGNLMAARDEIDAAIDAAQAQDAPG